MVEDIQCGITTRPATAAIMINGKTITQPDIINITISRSRGQPIGTATGSFHYKVTGNSERDDVGSSILIYLNGHQAFIGKIKRVDVSPDFRCMGDFIVKFSAEDAMYRLVGKNYTRRQKQAALGVLAFITGVSKRVTVTFDSPEDITNIERGNSPVEWLHPSTKPQDWTSTLSRQETDTLGLNHPMTRIADQFTSGGSGGMTVHDHSSLEQLGPAVSVFGIK